MREDVPGVSPDDGVERVMKIRGVDAFDDLPELAALGSMADLAISRLIGSRRDVDFAIRDQSRLRP